MMYLLKVMRLLPTAEFLKKILCTSCRFVWTVRGRGSFARTLFLCFRHPASDFKIRDERFFFYPPKSTENQSFRESHVKNFEIFRPRAARGAGLYLKSSRIRVILRRMLKFRYKPTSPLPPFRLILRASLRRFENAEKFLPTGSN